MTHLTFRQKLWIPLISSLICVLAVAGFGAVQVRSARLEERLHSLKELGDMAISITKGYADAADAGKMTVDDAKRQALAKLRSIRFDGNNYISIVDSKGSSVMNPAKPETEGKDFWNYQDAGGTYVYREMAKIALGSGEGYVDYLTPRLGSEKPVRKRSHVVTFRLWDWSIVTGAYLDDVDRDFIGSLWQMLELMLGVGAILAGVLYLVNRSLQHGLGGTPEYASEVVGVTARGDLTIEILTMADNEESILYQLRNMQSQLRSSISRAVRAADSIGTATEQLATGNLDLSQRTEEQAASLQQTAASVQEFTSVAQRNAENARLASKLANDAFSIATEGERVAADVVTTMADIKGGSTKVIEILSIIESIAFQTNILALNAAVEAARAGEQGKGFAVVASEVRVLAQRTATALKDIEALVKDSNGRIEAGATLVGKAGEHMLAIVDAVRRVTGITDEIASASEQQRVGVDEVNRAIEQIDQVTQQNAALVEEAAAATQSVRDTARELVASMGSFKVR